MRVIKTAEFSKLPQQAVTNEMVQQAAQQIKSQLGLQQFSVYLSNNGDLKLNNLIVPKDVRRQGIGSKAVEMLTQFADTHGLRLILSPGIQDDRHGTTSRNRLVRFYKRFGFEENKGRKKDFSISEGMYRMPFSR